MTAIDPISYMRLPKLDVVGAIGLAKILLQRVPKSSSPAVRRAASALEQAVTELKTAWKRQAGAVTRRDSRPAARNLGAAWRAIRDRLASYDAFPEGNPDRTRAFEIHDTLLRDGRGFLLARSMRQHAESDLRISLIDERGLAKDLERLVGDSLRRDPAHGARGVR